VAVVVPEALPLPDGVGQFPSGREAAGFARRLYATLREIDRQGFEVVVVVPPSNSGLGRAIRDRLTKAAAKRS
jgi:L-threonylcarbamoyladenylate synthase